jgi:hypothetical protein
MGVILTKEEKIGIAKFVMESHQGITITEAKSNNDIREEIKLNFEYYTVIKEIFSIPNGLINEGILAIFGGIKDFLTGTDIVKNIVGWLQEKISAIIKYFSSKFGPYIPDPVKKGANWLGNAAKFIAGWVKWVLQAFTYKGLARLFAMVKFKKLKPTDEQKKCMMMLAKKVYVSIIISLVIIYLIKIGPGVIGYLVAKGGAAISQASIMPLMAPLIGLLTKIGLGGAAKVIGVKSFSAYSAIAKTKSAIKKSKEIDAKEEKYEIDSKGKGIIQSIKDEFTEYFTGWKEAWGECDNKNIKEHQYKYRLT